MKSSNKYLIISFGIIILYYLLFIITGKDSYVQIIDNLDANVPYVKILVNNGMVFPETGVNIPQVMNGIPSSSIMASYDFSLLIFNAFGMYWGYLVNRVLMALIAFLGMYLLLKNQFSVNKNQHFILIMCSLAFSILPFWSYMMSVAGIPLVLFALFNLRNGNIKIYNWLLIVFYAFSSSLILVGVFLIIVLGIIWLTDLLIRKKKSFFFLLGIFLLGISYLISHYPLIYTFLFENNIVSHRVEFHSESISFFKAIKKSIIQFLFNQHHARSLNLLIIFPVFFVLTKQILSKKVNSILVKLLLFIGLSSIFYGFIHYGPINSLNERIMKVIPLQFQRFHFLHSICWYILLFISLKEIITKYKWGKKFAAFFIAFQLIFAFYNNEFIVNYGNKNSTFKSFYAENLFENVKNAIDKDIKTYKVISVGFHPAVAQYNGFYTIDGYITSYPLSYKHRFRRIIKNELEKNQVIKTNFDNWGSRCYGFSAELGSNPDKLNNEKIENLDFNYDLLLQMNCQYIFSAVSINTNKNQRLQILKEFKDESKSIFVYKII